MKYGIMGVFFGMFTTTSLFAFARFSSGFAFGFEKVLNWNQWDERVVDCSKVDDEQM